MSPTKHQSSHEYISVSVLKLDIVLIDDFLYESKDLKKARDSLLTVSWYMMRGGI